MATYPTLPPGSTLAAIQQKVRRLTRSPSEALLGTDELNNYINTFVVYDIPENIRTFNLKTTFTFITNPGQDEYPTDMDSFSNSTGFATNAAVQPLFNFQNRYISVHPPVYVAGYQAVYTQSQEQLFAMYPKVESISTIGPMGDGVTTQFTGFINTSQAIITPGSTQQQNMTLLQKQVLFESVDLNGNGTSLVDAPILDQITGNPTIWGSLFDPQDPPVIGTISNPIMLNAPYFSNGQFPRYNYINYSTGQYFVTFTNAPGAGKPINSQTVPVITSIPQAVMCYNNTFTVRPVPDQPYRIEFDAYVRPTQLFQLGQPAQLEEWWQYIAYGAAKKIFEDRMDMDSVQMLMPEYDKQERMCLRRTIVQITNERVSTIYTEQSNINGWGGQGGFGGGTF